MVLSRRVVGQHQLFLHRDVDARFDAVPIGEGVECRRGRRGRPPPVRAGDQRRPPVGGATVAHEVRMRDAEVVVGDVQDVVGRNGRRSATWRASRELRLDDNA